MPRTEEELNALKQQLAEREYYSLGCGDIIQILIDGCKGYNDLTEEELEQLAEQEGIE